jgi:beta-hydroxylase
MLINFTRLVFRLPIIVAEAVIDFFVRPVNYYDNKYEISLLPLKDNFQQIQKEVLDYVSIFNIRNLEDIIPGNENIPSSAGVWKAAPLKIFNKFFEKPLVHCPTLYGVLKKIKTIKLITISKLAPKSSIKPHRGAHDAFIRAHLGIKIPSGDTALVVGGERREWREGEFLFFNDRQYHTAYNNTDEDRIILLMDITRPLPFPLNLINSFIVWLLFISPFFRQIIKNIDAD